MSNLKKEPINYLLIPFFLSFQAICLYKHLKIKKYDLIHAHWLIPQGLICALVSTLSKKNTPPILCTMHGSDLVSLQNKFLLSLKAWALKKITRITVVSRSLIPYLEKLGYTNKDIDIRSMGVDLNNTFKNTLEKKNNIKQLIYVGRLVEIKGVNILIQAIYLLIKEFPDIKLQIIGDGPHRHQLESLTTSLGLDKNINFLGVIPNIELPAFYSSAGIAILPSIVQEGFGLVMVEAMGCECVPIVSDSESSREIITNNVNGLLFEMGNHEDLAERIRELLSDTEKYRHISQNARASVLDKYDWSNVVIKFNQIINSVIDRQKTDNLPQ